LLHFDQFKERLSLDRSWCTLLLQWNSTRRRPYLEFM